MIDYIKANSKNAYSEGFTYKTLKIIYKINHCIYKFLELFNFLYDSSKTLSASIDPSYLQCQGS